MTARETALAFADAINARDPNQLASLMTEDHTFVDSDGSGHGGREEMRVGWQGYYAMVPDYRIHVEDVLVDGDLVGLFGTAEGTFADEDGALNPENHWSVTAAWRARIRESRVAVWQVYVNPDAMLEPHARTHKD